MPDQASYCPGDEITLTASGADTYYWFDERSIDPVSEGNPYTFKLFENRTYYLLGENLERCKDSTSLFIDLDDMANVSIYLTSIFVSYYKVQCIKRIKSNFIFFRQHIKKSLSIMTRAIV